MTQTTIKLTTNKAITVGPARGGAVFLEVSHRDGVTGTIEALYLTADQADVLAGAIAHARNSQPGISGMTVRHIGQA